jgi:hypothetical protein
LSTEQYRKAAEIVVKLVTIFFISTSKVKKKNEQDAQIQQLCSLIIVI